MSEHYIVTFYMSIRIRPLIIIIMIIAAAAV